MQLLNLLQNVPTGTKNPLNAEQLVAQEGAANGVVGGFESVVRGLLGPNGDTPLTPGLESLTALEAGELQLPEGLDAQLTERLQSLLEQITQFQQLEPGAADGAQALEAAQSLLATLSELRSLLLAPSGNELGDGLPGSRVADLLGDSNGVDGSAATAASGGAETTPAQSAMEAVRQAVLDATTADGAQQVSAGADQAHISDSLQDTDSAQDPLGLAESTVDSLQDAEAMPLVDGILDQYAIQSPFKDGAWDARAVAQAMAGTRAELSGQSQEQVDAALARFVAALPPELQAALQRLAEPGNALPSAAAETPAVASLDPGPRELLRGLLSRAGDAAPKAAARSDSAASAVDADDPPLPGVLSKGLAMDKLALVPQASNANITLPGFEPDRLRQAVMQLAQTMGEQVSAPPATESPISPGFSLAAQAAAARAPAVAPPVPMSIPMPPGEDGWSRALGERIAWMVGRNVQAAEVRLNPPELGPMAIRVAVQNDQASVTINAQHPFTREALEAAIPRLREMMSESNLNLVSVDVGQRDSGHARGGPGDTGAFGASTGQDEEAFDAASMQSAHPPRVSQGLVDDFA